MGITWQQQVGADPEGPVDTGGGGLTQEAADAAYAPLSSLRSHSSFFRSGYYSSTPHTNRTTAGSTLNQLNFQPLWVPRALTIDRIAVEVTGAGGAGAVQRLGIYSDAAAKDHPGALLLDAGTVDATGTGLLAITINQALTAGLYWLAVVSQVATSTCRVQSGTWANIPHTSQGASLLRAWIEAGVGGALPAAAAPVASGDATPLVYVRQV